MQDTTLQFEVVEVPEQTFAFVVRRVAAGEIGEFVRGGIARVAEFAGRHGGPVGAPMAISSAPDETGALVIEAGWPVLPGTEAELPVEVRVLPATRAAVHRYVGPYEGLGAGFYGELFSALHDQGLTPSAGPRERYLTSPEAGEEPVTEIVWPVT